MTILAIVGRANGFAAVELHTARSLYLQEKCGDGVVNKHERLGFGTKALFNNLPPRSKWNQASANNAPDHPLTAHLGTELAEVNLDKIRRPLMERRAISSTPLKAAPEFGLIIASKQAALLAPIHGPHRSKQSLEEDPRLLVASGRAFNDSPTRFRPVRHRSIGAMSAHGLTRHASENNAAGRLQGSIGRQWGMSGPPLERLEGGSLQHQARFFGAISCTDRRSLRHACCH